MLWRENPIKSCCCPQSWPWFQLVPSLANGDAGRAHLSHWLPLWAYHLPAQYPPSEAITQIGGADPQVDTLYIVRFFTWRKSICIKMIIPQEASLRPSVTFSHLEIVLFSLLQKKKKLQKWRSKWSYKLPLLKEVPLPGHLYVNCVWFREEKDATWFMISTFISMNSLLELFNQRHGSCNLLIGKIHIMQCELRTWGFQREDG